MLMSKLVFLNMVMLLVAVGTRANGASSRRRSPVRFYAGVNTPEEQAVLILPDNATPSQRPANSAALQTQETKEHVAAPRDDAADDKAVSAALHQMTPLGTPGRSGVGLEKLRQQMQRRTAGSSRHAVGGRGNSRLRPGMSRLGVGDALVKHRRHPLASLPGVSQMRTALGASGHRLTLQNATGLLSSTPQSKMDDFVSEWHNFYSRSQTKDEDPVSIVQGPATESTRESENLKHEPVIPASLAGYGHDRTDTATATNRKSNANSSPIRTQAKVPSLHDMTSMHFKINSSSSSSQAPAVGAQSETKKARETKIPDRQSKRTAGNPLSTAAAITTTPSSARRSATTKTSPDGKDIFDSIQSIFKAARTDERALSSMKNINHGNTSPQSLDIFSGIAPTFGFQPSHHAESLIGSTIDSRAQQVQTNSVPQAAPHSITLITSQRPFISELDAQASNSIPSNVQLSRQPTGGDLLLQLDHTLPVQAREEPWAPEHREEGEEGIILDEGLTNDVIMGRPAALIQAPPETSPVLITAPPPQRHFGNPVYFRNTEEVTTQRAPEQYSSPSWHPEEVSPLLDFINTKYKPQHLDTIPSSVTSLQSMINAGRIPEVFRRNQVMDIIREDRLRHGPQSVDRVGKPLRNAEERTHTHPKVKDDVGSGGQFVAVSSIALLLAFCSYFLYAGSAAKEARKVLHPLKDAVDEARNGLHYLLRGLDEYEDHLNKEEENEKLKRQHPQEQNTTQSDIPTIFKKMWNTVVPPEVRVSSGIVKHDAEGYRPVNSSALIRSNKPQSETTSSARQPHAIMVATGNKNGGDELDLSQDKHDAIRNNSMVQTVIGLSSVANSFLNSLINSKAVESIISQLKSSTPSTENHHILLMEPRGERKISSPNQMENKHTLKLRDETVSKDRNITNQNILQSFKKTHTTTNTPHTTTNSPHAPTSSPHANPNRPHATTSNPNTPTIRPYATPKTFQATTNNPKEQDDTTTPSSWPQDVLVTFAGTGLGVREVTEQPSPATNRVIINNLLHVPHHPETDPPRTSAFVNNVPLKPAL